MKYGETLEHLAWLSKKRGNVGDVKRFAQWMKALEARKAGDESPEVRETLRDLWAASDERTRALLTKAMNLARKNNGQSENRSGTAETGAQPDSGFPEDGA